jgi:hypothetical protein
MKENTARAYDTLCASRMIRDRVDLRILLSEILEEEADAVVFPADPDLTFTKPNITRSFELQKWHVFEMYRMYPDRQVIKYEGLKLSDAGTVYFCKIPTWIGG